MTFEDMKKIVVDTLNCEEEKVTMEASLTEDLEADSLDAVELNMALEDAFGVSIPDEELGYLFNTVKKVADLKGIAESGYRVIVNTNDDAQQSVHHIHVHVLGGAPMNSGDPSAK